MSQIPCKRLRWLTEFMKDEVNWSSKCKRENEYFISLSGIVAALNFVTVNTWIRNNWVISTCGMFETGILTLPWRAEEIRTEYQSFKWCYSWDSVQKVSHLYGKIIIIGVHCSFRNIGCLWVLSTSVYQLPRTLVRSSFYPLPWWPIFSSYS